MPFKVAADPFARLIFTGVPEVELDNNEIVLKSFNGSVVGRLPIEIVWLDLLIFKVVETTAALKLLSAGKVADIITEPAWFIEIVLPVTDAIFELLELYIKLELLRLFFEGSIISKFESPYVLLILLKFPIPGSALLIVIVMDAFADL